MPAPCPRSPCRSGFRDACCFSLIVLLALAGCAPGGDEADAEIESEPTETIIADDASPDPGGNDTDTTTDATPGFTPGAGDSIAARLSPLSSLLPGLSVIDFVVVGSRRVGRTTMEYVLRLKLGNAATTSYENVVATLTGAPAHIAIIDPVAVVGDVPPNSTIVSADSFTLHVDLSLSTSFDDFVWLIEGDVPPPAQPPPPKQGTGSPGIYMNVDNLRIRGESTSKLHRDWIELSSLGDGLRRIGTSTDPTRERTQFVFDGVHLTKDLDRSSVELREALLRGTIFTEVEIDFVARCGDTVFTALAITLSTARIEAFASAANADDVPSESLSFNYTRIETMYTRANPDCTLDTPVFSVQDGKLLEL